MGLWVRAGSWCAQQLTDGVVPAHIATMLGTPQQAARLVRVGLWVEVNAGFSFHEWDERQPKKEAIESERAAARERMRLARERKRGESSTKPQVSGARSGEVPRTDPNAFGNPDPSRPDPSLKDTLSLTDTPPESARRSAPREPEGFADFWAAYPRKTGKGTARTAYSKALTKGVTPGELAAAADDYTAATSHAKTEERFIPHPATWLGQERWADRPVTTPTTPEPISPWDRVYKTGPDDD